MPNHIISLQSLGIHINKILCPFDPPTVQYNNIRCVSYEITQKLQAVLISQNKFIIRNKYFCPKRLRFVRQHCLKKINL